MKKNGIVQGTLLCAFFFSMNIHATYYDCDNNCGCNYYTYSQQKKNPKAVICKYGSQGYFLAHGGNQFSDYKSDCNFYDQENNTIHSISSTLQPLKSCVLASNSFQYAYILSGPNDTVLWIDPREDFPVPFHDTSAGDVKNVYFSNSDNLLLISRTFSTIVFDRTREKKITWDRTGKDYSILNEKYVIETIENTPLFSIFPIEENPEEMVLRDKPWSQSAQSVVSNNQKIIACAWTFDMQDIVYLTRLVFYDAETLKQIAEYNLPGKIYSGNRKDQHKSMYFSSDDQYFLIHFLVKDEGLRTWYIDIKSGKKISIPHKKNNPIKLYELCEDKVGFAGLAENKALIYDIRKPNDSVNVELEGISHVALNPNPNSKVQAAMTRGKKLYYYMGGGLLVKRTKNNEEYYE